MLDYREKMCLKVFDYVFKDVGEYDEVLLVKSLVKHESELEGDKSTVFYVFGSRFAEKSTSHKIWLRSLTIPASSTSSTGLMLYPECKPLMLTLPNVGVVDCLPSMTIPQQYLSPRLTVNVLPISDADEQVEKERMKVAVERAKIELGRKILAELSHFSEFGLCIEEGYRGGRTLLTHRAGASEEELFLKIDLEKVAKDC